MSVFNAERLIGKTVVITGASSGIGAATAVLFAKAGANVVILARRLDALEKVADACRAAHVAGSFADAQVAALALDVSDKERVAGLLARLPARLQAADVLVNNAGLGATPGNIGSVALADVDAVFGVNVVGVVALTQLFLGGFKERGRGHIINLGSVVSREAAPGDPIYSASKWALRALSDAMRKELVATPIRVTEIQPGLVDTGFWVARQQGDTALHDSIYRGFQPLTSEDIAEEIVWAAARPPHVQIAEVLVFPTNQAMLTIHRTDEKAE